MLYAFRDGFRRGVDEHADLLEREAIDDAQQQRDPLLRLDAREALEDGRELLAGARLRFRRACGGDELVEERGLDRRRRPAIARAQQAARLVDRDALYERGE